MNIKKKYAIGVLLIIVLIVSCYVNYKQPIRVTKEYVGIKYGKSSEEIVEGLNVKIDGYLKRSLPFWSDKFDGRITINGEKAIELDLVYGKKNKYLFGMIKNEENQSIGIYILDNFEKVLTIGEEYNIALPAKTKEEYREVYDRCTELVDKDK
ncbi:hypothetical protein [Sporosalibacterium faouarense]|uniref:hypothetical protein n=1 Tax=Sporosalibacterium faouarense TaxID=516123 RepID=UPI00192B1355|nr:hypothetical protein [Sporosalibacterium faouarense]